MDVCRERASARMKAFNLAAFVFVVRVCVCVARLFFIIAVVMVDFCVLLLFLPCRSFPSSSSSISGHCVVQWGRREPKISLFVNYFHWHVFSASFIVVHDSMCFHRDAALKWYRRKNEGKNSLSPIPIFGYALAISFSLPFSLARSLPFQMVPFKPCARSISLAHIRTNRTKNVKATNPLLYPIGKIIILKRISLSSTRAKSIIISEPSRLRLRLSIETAKSKTASNIEAVNISILVKLNTLRKQKRHQRQQWTARRSKWDSDTQMYVMT